MLLFPPVRSRYRYLIHKTAAQYPQIKSQSIGKDINRQTAVFLDICNQSMAEQRYDILLYLQIRLQ